MAEEDEFEIEREQLDRYSLMVMEKMKENQPIDSMLFNKYIELYAKVVLMDYKLPGSTQKLFNYVQVAYNRQFSGKTLKYSEAIAVVHSNYQIYYIINDILNQREKVNQLMAMNKERPRQLLTIVSSRPGIIHKELAKKLKISPSALSQLLSKYQSLHFVSSITAGREKSYFIERDGERFLSQVVKIKNESSKNLQNEDYVELLEKKASDYDKLLEKANDYEKRIHDLEVRIKEKNSIVKFLFNILMRIFSDTQSKHKIKEVLKVISLTDENVTKYNFGDSSFNTNMIYNQTRRSNSYGNIITKVEYKDDEDYKEYNWNSEDEDWTEIKNTFDKLETNSSIVQYAE